MALVAAIGVVAVPLATWWLAPRLKMRRLVEQLRDPSRRFAASQQLLDRGPEAVPWLIEVVQEPGHPGRAEAIEILGRLGDPRAVPALLAVKDEDLAEERLRALGEIRGPQALQVVLAALNDEPLLELAALQALAEWPGVDAQVVPLLVERLDDHLAGVRRWACRGLGFRRHKESEPKIRQLMNDPTEPPIVREDAAWALLQIGTPTARASVQAAYEKGLVTLEQ